MVLTAVLASRGSKAAAEQEGPVTVDVWFYPVDGLECIVIECELQIISNTRDGRMYSQWKNLTGPY